MSYTRDESDGHRLDRNWTDLLQEFRVLQTGVQLLAGFLLTLPFHDAFEDLDGFQRGLYLALVLLAAVTTAGMLVPIAVHRRVFQRHVKHRLVLVGHKLAKVVLVLVACLITGIATFIFDVVLDRTAGLVVGAAMVVLSVVVLAVVPALAAHAEDEEDEEEGTSS